MFYGCKFLPPVYSNDNKCLSRPENIIQLQLKQFLYFDVFGKDMLVLIQ